MIYLYYSSPVSVASNSAREAKHDGMANDPRHSHPAGDGNDRPATGRGHPPGTEAPQPVPSRQGRKTGKGDAKGAATGTVYDFYAAAESLDADIANLRAKTQHAIRFLEREAAARSARIEKYLQTIEESVEQSRPSDVEGA